MLYKRGEIKSHVWRLLLLTLPILPFSLLSLVSRVCLRWPVMRTVKYGRMCAGLWSCCWKSALTA